MICTTKSVTDCFPVRMGDKHFQSISSRSCPSPSHVDQLLCFLDLFSWARAKDNLAPLASVFRFKIWKSYICLNKTIPKISHISMEFPFPRLNSFGIWVRFSRVDSWGIFLQRHSLLHFFPMDTWDLRHTLQFSCLFMHITYRKSGPKMPACAVDVTKKQWLALLLDSDPWSQNQLRSKTELNGPRWPHSLFGPHFWGWWGKKTGIK